MPFFVGLCHPARVLWGGVVWWYGLNRPGAFVAQIGQMPGMRPGLFDPRQRAGADVAAFGHDAVCHLDSGAGAAFGLS